MPYLNLEGANELSNKFAEITNEKFKIHESHLNEHEDRIKRIDSNVADHLNRIRKLEEENVRLKTHITFIYVMFIIVALFIILSDVFSAKAATIDMRDESLGGFSYMMDCLEKNDIPEDYDILVRIVEAEATGGNHEQKMNVASCVLARVEAPQWPDNIEDVVFQKQQFTPVWDGRYYTVTITQSTKEAVDEVLKFGKTHDCLWFCSDGSYRKENSYHRLNHTWVFFDGEHHYTKKDDNGRYTSWHRTEFGDSIFFDGEHHYFEGEKYD